MKTQAVMYLSVLNCEKNTFRKKKYCNQSSPAALTTNDTEDLFKHAEKQIKGKFQEHVNATTTSTFVSNLAFISHSRVFFALGAWLKKSRKKKIWKSRKDEKQKVTRKYYFAYRTKFCTTFYERGILSA